MCKTSRIHPGEFFRMLFLLWALLDLSWQQLQSVPPPSHAWAWLPVGWYHLWTRLLHLGKEFSCFCCHTLALKLFYYCLVVLSNCDSTILSTHLIRQDIDTFRRKDIWFIFLLLLFRVRPLRIYNFTIHCPEWVCFFSILNLYFTIHPSEWVCPFSILNLSEKKKFFLNTMELILILQHIASLLVNETQIWRDLNFALKVKEKYIVSNTDFNL